MSDRGHVEGSRQKEHNTAGARKSLTCTPVITLGRFLDSFSVPIAFSLVPGKEDYQR